MKPINTLSALVSAVSVTNGGNSKRFSLTPTLTNGGDNFPIPQDRLVDGSSLVKLQDGSQTPPTTDDQSPPSHDSAATPSGGSTQSDEKMEKKLLGSLETSLNVFKVSPLSMFINNNKVGSSFSAHQQQLHYRQQNQLQQPQQQRSLSTALPVGSRKARDSGALLFMLAFLGFLAYIIWDGLIVKETDVNLIVHGHDSYGNICGRENRPIKFVEKSGRNYTNKPYTKYTLINSQFERYTLDSDRLVKKGELFYVKHEGEVRVASSSPSPFRYTLEEAQEKALKGDVASIARLIDARVRGSANQHQTVFRGKRLAALPSEENQTLLKELKSTLMYQYPPMHGYSPSQAAAANIGGKRQQTATVRLKQDSSGSGGENSSNWKRQQDAPQLEVSASQAEHTFAKPQQLTVTSRRASMATSSPLQAQTGAMTVITTSAIRSSSSAPEAVNERQRGPNSLQGLQNNVVMFDDHANDSERYDHMLVVPTSTNLRARTSTASTVPEGINLNDVSSQLLYLTECVDSCPRDHVELIFYRCMPKNWRFSLFPNAINVTRTFIDDIMTDVSHCYRELIYIFSFALVLSLALLILLRFLASFIIWSCLTLLVTLFLSMASYSWLNYYYQIVDLNNLIPHDTLIYPEKVASTDKWLMGAIFLTFATFAIIGTIIFMRKRILLVTMLFRESGKAIADMPLLLLQPLLTFAALVAITALWSIGLICLQSMKMPIIDMHTGFVVFKAETLYKVMKWYHVFAFLWVSHFAIACQHYVIGAAVSKWYFSTDRYNLHSPIGSSVSELILYYLGSVALGSFLVAIFKVVRIITRQIQYLVQRNCMSPPNSNGTNSPSALNQTSHLSTSCCGSFSYVWRLFIWFFDNIVMIINRDAYVEIAIHGHSFLAGAKRAFTILASNPLKLLAIKSVSNVLLIIAKMCVVFGTISMAMLLLEEKTQQLNYSWSPILISSMYAYIVAHWFLSVYEMVIDALFICYCEDYERSKSQQVNNQINGTNFMSQILNNGQIY